MTKQPILPAEPPGELARLRKDLLAFYCPVNSQERMAVERVALAQQSILRAARLENSLFESVPVSSELHTLLEGPALNTLMRFQAQAERLYRRAVQELVSLQAQRPVPAVAPIAAPKPQLVPMPAAPTALPPAAVRDQVSPSLRL